MPASRRILAAASATAAALALAAPAGAATVTTLPCVPLAAGSEMPVGGTGFTPGGRVSVYYATAASPTPIFLTGATADPAGNFNVVVAPPLFAKLNTQLQTYTLAARDETNAAIVASTQYKQVRVGYTTNPETGRPTITATHTVRGFPAGKNTYLHFRYRGQTKRNVKLGKTSAPCGIVSRRMDLLPTRSRPGTWTVYVDQKAVFSPRTRPSLKYSFIIRQTFG
jgi:hypothetical protein